MMFQLGGCFDNYCLNPMFVLVGSINRSGLLQLSFDKLFVFGLLFVFGGGARQAGFVTSCCPRFFVVVFLRCVLCVSYKSPKQGLNLSRS